MKNEWLVIRRGLWEIPLIKKLRIKRGVRRVVKITRNQEIERHQELQLSMGLGYQNKGNAKWNQ